MPDNLLNLLMALFILSLLSERVAELLKFQPWFKLFFRIRNTTLKLPSEMQEQQRYYRILKINISVAIVVATILRADLFYLLVKSGDMQLGWPVKITELYPSGGFWRYCQIVLGCICTGFSSASAPSSGTTCSTSCWPSRKRKDRSPVGFPSMRLSILKH
ncbi:hypothetical protein [Paraflavitalea speifideaquila]|uniref:hypothetical protein n=1 Tax=Paraflavitalea speifideaquila TaxID=3076558 RepID=UPI0028EF441E|nr:hypothetical protein [Paraflavitalea speifideiaquila]